MEAKDFIKKNLIVNSKKEEQELLDIVDEIIIDFETICQYAENGMHLNKYDFEESKGIIKKINTYVERYHKTNIGGVLLFLNKLPVLANEFFKQYQELNEVPKNIAEDSVESYIKVMFNHAHTTLFEKIDEKQIGVLLYQQCEKFIDALVFEFKQDISPMIDKNDLVYDDIFYLRRLLVNLANNNENYSFSECEKCTRDECDLYTKCRTLPDKMMHEKESFRLRTRIKILDNVIDGGSISKIEQDQLQKDEQGKLILKLVNLPKYSEKHKKVKFSGESKIFSIISAQRFDKILENRYNKEAYKKDKDIYYILRSGVDSSIFKGDLLFENMQELKNVYNIEENEK